MKARKHNSTYKELAGSGLIKLCAPHSLDFLLQKQRGKKGNSLSSYKKKILGVTTWSDSDLEVFQENQDLFNSFWKPGESF